MLSSPKNSGRPLLSIKELALFAMLGALMYVSKMALEFLPNVHLLACFIVAFTRVFRRKALWIIYTFAFLTGLFNGFSLWWPPYLYLWTVLWGAVMLLPEELPKKWEPLIYMGIAALHGLLYGTLYAPYQALVFGLSFKGMLAWIAAGFPWDCVHAASNFAVTVLAVPIIRALRRVYATF
jgi:energy-coupling factor transport system substrate-specific component